MQLTEAQAEEVKNWVVRKLEDMYGSVTLQLGIAISCFP